MAGLRLLRLFVSLTLLLLLASCIQLIHATDLELNTSIQDGARVDQPPSGQMTIPDEATSAEIDSVHAAAAAAAATTPTTQTTASEPVTPPKTKQSTPPLPVADSRTERLESVSKSSRDRVAKSRKSATPGSQPHPVETPLLANQRLSSAEIATGSGLKSLPSNGSKTSFGKVSRPSASADGPPKSPKRKQPSSSSSISSGKPLTRKAPTNKPARKSDLKTNEERQAAIRAKVENELNRRRQIALDEEKRGQPTSSVNPPSTEANGSKQPERKKPKGSKLAESTSSSSSSRTQDSNLAKDGPDVQTSRPSTDRQNGLPSSTRRNGSNAPASNENVTNDSAKPKSKKPKAKSSSDSADIETVIRDKITQPVPPDPQPPATSSSPVDDQIDKFERELAAKKSTPPVLPPPVPVELENILEKKDENGQIIEIEQTKSTTKVIPDDQEQPDSNDQKASVDSTPSKSSTISSQAASKEIPTEVDGSQSDLPSAAPSKPVDTPQMPLETPTSTHADSTSESEHDSKPSGTAPDESVSSKSLPEIPAEDSVEIEKPQTQPVTPTPVSGSTTKEEHLAPSDSSMEAKPSTPIQTIPGPDDESSSKEAKVATSSTEKTEPKAPTLDLPPAPVAASTPEPTSTLTPTPSGPIVTNLTPVAPATPPEVTPVVIDEDRATPASTVPKSELKEDPSASTNEEVIKAPIKPPTDSDSLVSNETPAVDNTPVVDTWKPVTPPRASSHTGLVIVFVLLSFLLFVGYKLKRCLASGDEDSEDRDLESGTLLSNGTKRSAPIIKPGSGQVIIDALTDDEDPEEAYQKKRLLQQQDASSTSTNASSRGMSLKASVPLKPQRTTSAKKTKVSLGARQLSDNED